MENKLIKSSKKSEEWIAQYMTLLKIDWLYLKKMMKNEVT